MNKTILLLCVLISATSCLSQQKNKQPQETQAQEAFVKDVDAATFKTLVEADKGIILDVRTPEEIAQGYINNASMVDYYDEQFIEKINLIDKDKEVYVYCRSGGRSSEAIKILQDHGFKKIYQLEKGIKSWQDAGFSLVQTETQTDAHIKTMTLDELTDLLKTDKPVLIDFHTVWCAPCKKMAPIIDAIETDYKDQAIVMRVDVDKSKDVAKAYNIQAVPVFIVFKNGLPQWTHNGIIAKEALAAELDKAL